MRICKLKKSWYNVNVNQEVSNNTSQWDRLKVMNLRLSKGRPKAEKFRCTNYLILEVILDTSYDVTKSITLIYVTKLRITYIKVYNRWIKSLKLNFDPGILLYVFSTLFVIDFAWLVPWFCIIISQKKDEKNMCPWKHCFANIAFT